MKPPIPTTRWLRAALTAITSAALAVTVAVAPGAHAVEPTLPPITSTISDAGFSHPGVGLTAEHLRNAQEQVAAGVEPWASYFDAMSQTKYAARGYKAELQGASDDQPIRDAYDEVGMRGRAHRDSIGAMTQALMYTMTGDETYRANALHTIRTWSSLDSSKYSYFPDAHIHTGGPLYQMLVAAEIIRSTTPASETLDGYDLRWTARDDQRIADNFIRPTIDTFLYSQNRLWNQHLYGVVGMIAGAIFLDDADLYAERVEWFSVNSTYTPTIDINGGDVNGSLSATFREIAADDPLNPYGTSFIQHMEMGRDQAHAEGDVTLFGVIARMLHNQETLLDPQAGTVSTAADAVSPYAFLDNRILHGADVFTAYMMGKEVPWIDTSGGPGALSQAYRGRLRDGLSELYYQYTYVAGVDVEQEAPHVAALHEHRDGPLYYYGSGIENFWMDRGSDFTGAEYWVALPKELASQNVAVPPIADGPETSAVKYGLALGKGAKEHFDGVTKERFVRLKPNQQDAAMAVRRMVWSDTSRTSLVGIRLRTNRAAELQLSRTAADEPFATIALPNTGDTWRYVWVDLDSSQVPPGTRGDNIVYLRAVDGSANIDIAGILAQATGILDPVRLSDSPSVSLVAVAGDEFSRSFAHSRGSGAVEFRGEGAPKGATMSVDGVLTWTPSVKQSGEHGLLVVASDESADTTLPVTITVAPTRAAAIESTIAGLDDTDSYTSTTWSSLTSALSAAEEASGSDPATFAAALESLRLAVADLELLNPLLSDGTLDYSTLVTSTLPATAYPALVDGDNQTTWGDQRVPSITLDFGAGYRVQAKRFGFLARNTFTNRAEGTNVYGSNDGATWTLLTSTPNAGREDTVEYVSVVAEQQDARFRFLKLQVDEPGAPSDPNYPGIWTLADFRIDGERLESVGALVTVSVSSPDAVAGRVVGGSTAELTITGHPAVSDLRATIQGQPALIDHLGNGTWTARATLPEPVLPSYVTFTVEHTTPDGKAADTIAAATDDTRLYLSTARGMIDDAFRDARVLTVDGTSTSVVAAEAGRLFDNDPTTHTDTRSQNGVIALTWDLGEGRSATLSGAEILVRQDGYGISRISDLRLEGSQDGVTWTRLTPEQPRGTLSWQPWQVSDNSEYRYLRLANGQIMGVAELRLYGNVS